MTSGSPVNVSIWNFATRYKVRKKVLLNLNAYENYWVIDGIEGCGFDSNH